jgi:hypothetical protein
VSLVRVLLGDGVRVLANLGDHKLDLECIRVGQSDGITHLCYRVVKPGNALVQRPSIAAFGFVVNRNSARCTAPGPAIAGD